MVKRSEAERPCWARPGEGPSDHTTGLAELPAIECGFGGGIYDVHDGIRDTSTDCVPASP